MGDNVASGVRSPESRLPSPSQPEAAEVAAVDGGIFMAFSPRKW